MFSRRGIKYAKRSLFFLLGILFFFLLSFLLTDRLNTNVHIFYYGWYGTPAVDGEWVHWNHRYLENWDTSDKKVYPTGDHQPPEDIGANFYPSLGPYSSRNETVIEQHFKWISDANIGVISVSWYPPGLSDENGPKSDELIPTLLRIAQKYNLKISSSEWSRLFSRKGDLTVRETELDGIFIALLVEMKHRYDIKKSSFDGFYTYFASNGFTYGSTWKNWKGLAGVGLR